MANYRSALGKSVDMAALAAKNEKTRAVGNMKVNARGDTIDAQGKIVQPVTSKVSSGYAKTVGNRSANVVKALPDKAVPNVVKKAPKIEELSTFEQELEAEMEDDYEVEQIKAKDMGEK